MWGAGHIVWVYLSRHISGQLISKLCLLSVVIWNLVKSVMCPAYVQWSLNLLSMVTRIAESQLSVPGTSFMLAPHTVSLIHYFTGTNYPHQEVWQE